MVDDPPPETLVEEREELMVSPLGGLRTLRTAHFLKPSSASIEDIPPFSLSQIPNFSSIKKTRFEVKFRGRRCPQKNWETWVNQLLPTHHQMWEKAGIFEAIMASKYQILRQNDLIFALAERWSPETNTFIFPWGESTLTLEDMMVLGGYSVLGSPIFTPLKTEELIMVEEELCKAHRSIRLGQAGFAGLNPWMEHFMNTGNHFEHEAFLALWLARYVLPNTSDTVSRTVFPVAIHLSRGNPIALAPAVLASIYRDLSLLKRSGISSLNLSGCESGKFTLELWAPFQLVQVWAWERFPALRPNPNLIKAGDPRLARWNQLRYTKVENVRRELDSAGDCFQWRPYAVAVNNWSFSKFYRENEEWVWVESDMDIQLLALALCIRPSELVGLDCTQQYLPHRVSMQFGIDQDLPGHVPRFNENLEAAWKNYCRPIRDAKLYVPARLFESDVTPRYFSWRTRPRLASEDAIKKDVPIKLSSKTRKRLPHLVCQGNEVNDQALISGDVVEDEEDNLTIGQLVNHGDKKRKILKDGLTAHVKPRPQSSLLSSKGLQKQEVGSMKDLDQTNQGDTYIEDTDTTELRDPLEKSKENGEEQSNCLIGLQKENIGGEKDLIQTNKDSLSVEDANTTNLGGSLEKMNKNRKEKGKGLTGDDKLICGSSSLSSKGLVKGDFARMNDLDQTNQGNISIEDADTTEPNVPLEKMNENGEEQSNGLIVDDNKSICGGSSSTGLQEENFGREKDLNQTNKDSLSVDDANTTRLGGFLEKMNKIGEEKVKGLTGNDKPICGSSSSSAASKGLAKGDFARMNDLDQTNQGNISIEDADTTEPDGPLEKMNENGGKGSIASKLERKRLDLEARVTKIEMLIDWMKARKLHFGHFENLSMTCSK